MIIIYGLTQPYKGQLANVVELVVQAIFFILLALESISYLKDTYNAFPPPQTVQAGTSLNETGVCKDETTGVSLFTIIQLTVFYTPFFLFIVVALFKLVLYIR